MSKVYQVIFQDEYNNLTLLGFFGNLADATDEINNCLSPYNVSIKSGDIAEYVGTFGMVFDTYISDVLYGSISEEKIDEIGGCMVRGFILDGDAIEEEITDVNSRAD